MSQVETPISTPGQILLDFAQRSWERFSYYGMRALLVLYLIHPLSDVVNPGRGWRESSANLLFGWYAGLIFLAPIVWGALVEKMIGRHRAVLLGGLTILLGHVILAAVQNWQPQLQEAVVKDVVAPGQQLGLSEYGSWAFTSAIILIVLGTGYFRPALELKSQDDAAPRQSRAALSNLRINLGVFGTVLLCGTLAEGVGWRWGFAALAVSMGIGLGAYAIARFRYLSSEQRLSGSRVAGAFLFVVSVAVALVVGWLDHKRYLEEFAPYVTALLQNEAFRTSLPASIGPLLLGVMVWYVAIQDKGQRAPTAALLILTIFYAFFWLGFHQLGSTFNVFAARAIDRRVAGWEVPVSWLQALNVFLVVIVAPWLARFGSGRTNGGRGVGQARRATIALFLLAGAFAVLSYAAHLHADSLRIDPQHPVRPHLEWVVATVVIISLAEALILPADLSFLRTTAPGRASAALIGIWLFAVFLANLGGGILASLAPNLELGETHMFWDRFGWFTLGGRGDFFLIFVLTSAGAGILGLIFAPIYRRLLASEKAERQPVPEPQPADAP
jgi:POT family proton-dependent oligopeptide transporter